jgi:hypothetical protein
MMHDLGNMGVIRRYLDSGLWIAVIGAGACVGIFLVLTVVLIVARTIAWAWGWS